MILNDISVENFNPNKWQKESLENEGMFLNLVQILAIIQIKDSNINNLVSLFVKDKCRLPEN